MQLNAEKTINNLIINRQKELATLKFATDCDIVAMPFGRRNGSKLRENSKLGRRRKVFCFGKLCRKEKSKSFPKQKIFLRCKLLHFIPDWLPILA